MKKVVVAVDIARLNSRFHKHHRKDGWFNVYFYRNGKKTQAKLGEDVKEEASAELSEEIYVFQEHLESILQSDAFMGEPTLEKLLDDIRGFGQSTENIRLRLIPEKTNNIEETPENN